MFFRSSLCQGWSRRAKVRAKPPVVVVVARPDVQPRVEPVERSKWVQGLGLGHTVLGLDMSLDEIGTWT